MERTFILVGLREITYKKDGKQKSFYKATLVDNESNILVCNLFNLDDDKVNKLSSYLMEDCTEFCSLAYDNKTMSYCVKISL